MCPPPRRLALEANGCFMVQVLREPYRIQGCGAIMHPKGELPPDDRTARSTRKDYAYEECLTLESPYKTFPFREPGRRFPGKSPQTKPRS
jgi:hypothetical protein